MSDEPVKICPQCGKGVRRLILGGAGVIFKGSGFYVTDKGGKAQKTKAEPKPADAADACAKCPKAKEGGGCKTDNAESKTA